MAAPDLPSIELLKLQAGWLRPARSWLLSTIGQTTRILDLGCGFGVIAGELSHVQSGQVIGLDVQENALGAYPELFGSALRVGGDATRLPFPISTFDLVFCQLALLWMPLQDVLEEIERVLRPGGLLLAIEPDYGGLIEYPPSTAVKPIWESALTRAGADPVIGRKIPYYAGILGFEVQVMLFNEMSRPEPGRFDLLAELPLEPDEMKVLDSARQIGLSLAREENRWSQIAHLPFMLVRATKPSR